MEEETKTTTTQQNQSDDEEIVNGASSTVANGGENEKNSALLHSIKAKGAHSVSQNEEYFNVILKLVLLCPCAKELQH